MKHPVLITLLLSLAGGTAFWFLHIPLAWLLGPMTAVLIWREAFGRRASWHIGLRNGGLALLGYMMGGTFTAEVALKIAGQLPSMAAATLLTVAFAMIIGWFTARRTGISLSSGLIGSIPGGLSQMAALCSEVRNTDLTVVTFMQTIRLMSVVFIVPFLAVHGLAAGGTEQGIKDPAAMAAADTAAVVRTAGIEGASAAGAAGHITLRTDHDAGREAAGIRPPEGLVAASAGQVGGSAGGSTVASVGGSFDRSAGASTAASAGGSFDRSAGASTGVSASGSAVASVGAAAGSRWLSANALWYALAVGLALWLAPLFRLPTPYMLGPMLAAAALCVTGLEAPKLPNLIIIGAQILVGAHMGTGTRLSSLANWRKLLPYAVGGAVGIVLFSLGIGYMLTLWHPMSFVTAFLAASPGGMTEMGLTGAAVHADLSIIVAYQMFRVLFILFIVPYILKGLLRAYPARTLTRPRKELDC